MNVSNSANSILLTHAVLTGLTPLVPIPLVDDLFYARFMRSLAQKLATHHARELTNEEIDVLVSSTKGGCALGCLGALVLYPIKKILSKIFFFLEVKRAADTMGRTYAHGILLDSALNQNAIQTHGAARVRAAIDAVLERTDTSVFTRAARGVVQNSPGVIRDLVARLTSKRAPNAAEVAQTAATTEKADQFQTLVARLQTALAQVSDVEIQRLRDELAKELATRTGEIDSV